VLQIKSFESWNRKQSSHQILNDFVSGTIEDTLEALESKFGWDVLHDKRTYRDVEGKTQNLTELDQLLRRLLRRFEAICISMDHKIVQESTCRDYIFSLLVTIYRGTEDFIAQERAKRNEPKIFEFVEKYARKWTCTGR
jgi:Domain of unknown function (DUF4760)